MKAPYCTREKPPVCLHALGQPLVNALHKEARELYLLLDAAYERLQHVDDCGPYEEGWQSKELKAILDKMYKIKKASGTDPYKKDTK
jgi:hypothetical protein